MKSITIAGGGISGLIAALFLKDNFKVTIVEKESECGGLLKSIKTKDGYFFDYGTHVLKETGIEEIDNVLFKPLKDQGWNTFPAVKAGNFFNGKLYSKSPFINLSYLNENDYKSAVNELMATERSAKKTFLNLREKSLHHLGKTITEKVIEEVIFKQFKCKIDDLLPNNPFLMSRMVIPQQEIIDKKQSDSFIDSKVAYPSYYDGVGELLNYYPSKKGIGEFISYIESLLDHPNITIKKEVSITQLESKDGLVHTVNLSNNEQIKTDRIIWSLPCSFLLKSLGEDLKTERPQFNPLSIHHFVIDKSFLTENHYVTNFDNSFTTFRVTLYPNLGNDRPKEQFNCTVEVIGNCESGDSFDENVILDELKKMGLVHPEANILHYQWNKSPSGFPVLSKNFFENVNKQCELIDSKYKNISLIGKSRVKAFFMHSTLEEAYNTAKELNNE